MVLGGWWSSPVYGWMFSEIPGFYLLMLVVLFFIVMPKNISRRGKMSPDDRGGENPSPPIDKKNKCWFYTPLRFVEKKKLPNTVPFFLETFSLPLS